MKFIIWGNRSSLPSSMKFLDVRNKIFKALEASASMNFNNIEEVEHFVDNKLKFSIKGTYGTNTACAEIHGGDDYIILEAGTGIRDFGNSVLKTGKIPSNFNIFITNLNWDHVHGFPFFVPAFIKGNSINFYACNNQLEETLVKQQSFPYFPVPIHFMQSKKNFNIISSENEYKISNFIVKIFNHPDDTIAYSFIKDSKKVVYSIGYKCFSDYNNSDLPDFFCNADLLIINSENFIKNNISDDYEEEKNKVNILKNCKKSNIKKLCLHYNDHSLNDQSLEELLIWIKKFETDQLKLYVSYDGLEINI